MRKDVMRKYCSPPWAEDSGCASIFLPSHLCSESPPHRTAACSDQSKAPSVSSQLTSPVLPPEETGTVPLA